MKTIKNIIKTSPALIAIAGAAASALLAATLVAPTNDAYAIYSDPQGDEHEVKMVDVYRLYNDITSEHLYTTSASEFESLANHENAWHGEGVAWQSVMDTSTVGVYRLYNAGLGAQGKMSHHYTSDKYEADVLVNNYGWAYDNNGEPIFYSVVNADGQPTLTTDTNKPIPNAVYRLYNDGLSAHHYTTDKNEVDTLVSDYGWSEEGVSYYAMDKNYSGVELIYCGYNIDTGIAQSTGVLYEWADVSNKLGAQHLAEHHGRLNRDRLWNTLYWRDGKFIFG